MLGFLSFAVASTFHGSLSPSYTLLVKSFFPFRNDMASLFDDDDERPTAPRQAGGKAPPPFRPPVQFNPPADLQQGTPGVDGAAGAPPLPQPPPQQQLPAWANQQWPGLAAPQQQPQPPAQQQWPQQAPPPTAASQWAQPGQPPFQSQQQQQPAPPQFQSQQQQQPAQPPFQSQQQQQPAPPQFQNQQQQQPAQPPFQSQQQQPAPPQFQNQQQQQPGQPQFQNQQWASNSRPQAQPSAVFQQTVQQFNPIQPQTRPVAPTPTAPPEVPVQRPLMLQHIPPTVNVVPPSQLTQQIQQAMSDPSAWDAFQALRKELEDSHNRVVGLHSQIAQLQLTHEKEAAGFREAAQAQIDSQRKELETATDHYNEAQSKIENLTGVLNRKAEHIMKIEQKLHESLVTVAAMTQKMAHVEDRARLAEGARQISEVRQRELELSLDHTAQLVNSMRKQLSSSNDEKMRALQAQYEIFEKNREELIAFYNQRELIMINDFNESIKQLQGIMDANAKDREEKASKFWRDTVDGLQQQYNALVAEANRQQDKNAKEMADFVRRVEFDKDKWYAQHQAEMTQLETRHKEREDHVLVDIARRERELGEREQRARVQRVQDEQDAKIALLTKEAELKGYYEKIVEDLRRGHEQDRERLTQAFRDQLQQLSSQHLNSERELERLHREKEREMAQRYRVAGYEVDDKKGQMDLQDVAMKTQSSLLSKFESIETRQRERAELSRAAFKPAETSSSAAPPPVKERTSLSGIGLPPGS